MVGVDEWVDVVRVGVAGADTVEVDTVGVDMVGVYCGVFCGV